MELTYSCGQTIQIKDFHPRTIHYSAKTEGEDWKELEKKVEKRLNEKVQEILKAKDQLLLADIGSYASTKQLRYLDTLLAGQGKDLFEIIAKDGLLSAKTASQMINEIKPHVPKQPKEEVTIEDEPF